MNENTQPALFTERMRVATREIHTVSNGLVRPVRSTSGS